MSGGGRGEVGGGGWSTWPALSWRAGSAEEGEVRRNEGMSDTGHLICLINYQRGT